MNEAPAAPALANKDFGPRFDPLPTSGPQIFTVVAFEFLPKHTFLPDKKTGVSEVADALRFYFGAIIDGVPHFISSWPMKYSIHEKSGYTKLYAAVTGSAPVAGSNPKDLLGKGVTGAVTNVAKVSKKGKAYTASKIESYSPVHPKLQGEVVSLDILAPALAEAMKPKDDGVPF